ncbi:MAG: inorganic phosphate transporter [Deltaproteobacteria bacterium]|nr:inorganic phosphate transporter [Deltaproteobacteria bacterium]MDL1961429.1 inorganic phosphate transporter [Deltaproteobacteria bacterium]
MNIDVIVLSIATLIGLYMAANIGANDLANAMGTAVGSRALTLKQAVIISIIANVLGASLAGGYVTGTISKGIIDPIFLVGAPDKLLLGMFAALIAAGLCVHLATFFGLPVSTTHAIVGAVVGFGIISVGAGAVSWGKITGIAVSWVISPVAGALFAGGIYYFLEKKVMAAKDPYAAAVHYAPAMIFLVVLVLILSFIFKGLKNLHLEIGFFYTVLLAIPCAALMALFGRKLVRWQVHVKCELGPNPQGFSPAECLFAQLQILTACYIAFAHGANDVANAVGPLAAIFSVIKTKSVALQVEVPFWMLFIGGIAVGGGLYIFGTRVLETIGKNITEITPIRGFCAQFGAATTILLCSRLGLPVSTTHVLVGSVVGVGLMRGIGTLDLRILKNIAFSWIVTLPITMVLAMVLYKVFTLFLL